MSKIGSCTNCSIGASTEELISIEIGFSPWFIALTSDSVVVIVDSSAEWLDGSEIPASTTSIVSSVLICSESSLVLLSSSTMGLMLFSVMSVTISVGT